MLYTWFSRLETVRVVTSPAEADEVFRFRYDTYVARGGLDVPGADHARRMIRDEVDDEPTTVHLYAGEPGALRGVARLRAFGPGGLPPLLQQRYATSAFPESDALAIAELTGFMIQPGLRGRMLLPAMVRTIYQVLVGEHGTDVLLGSCRPGLVSDYRKFGFRTYPAPLINQYDGISVPLMALLGDASYFERCGALAADLVSTHFAADGRIPPNLAPWAALFRVDEERLQASNAAAMEAATARLSESDAVVRTVFDSLPESTKRHLVDGGCVIDVARGSQVTVQGNVDRDLYVILQGVFTVHRDGADVASLGRGEFFGEASFFDAGRGRAATVRAATDGRVLLVRRDFLRTLTEKEPDAAFALFLALGGSLVRRYGPGHG